MLQAQLDTREAEYPGARDVLAALRGSKVYFDPLTGDNGTRLIELGSRWLIADLALDTVSRPADADVIVMNGGIWNAHRLSHLRRYTNECTGTPIVIMPTTCTTVPDLPQGHAPITLLVRDLPSLDVLAKMTDPTVEISIDHDAAFMIKNTEFFKDIKARRLRSDHVLVVERQDRESSTDLIVSSELFSPFSRSLKEKVPLGLRMAIKRPINRRRWQAKQTTLQNTDLVRGGMEWLQQNHPDLVRPVRPADVGLPDFYSFDEYVSYIAQASAVLTSRLHVAIFAGLLGKQTYLRPGANHKIPGVYEYSLKDLPNVHFFP